MKTHTMSRRRAARTVARPLPLLFAAATLAACASAPLPPTESLSRASAAIESAEQADARRYAGAELEEANRYLSEANKSVEAQRMAEADRLARQAQIAAELAIARSEAAKAEAINRDMERGAEALGEELQRQEDQQ